MTDWTQLEKDLEASTPGPWKTPYETWDNGWSIDTEGENSAVGVGVDNASEDRPLAIVAVEQAFGMDHILDANARLISRAPDLAALALAGKRLADAVKHQREMVCQDFDMQLKTVQAVDAALTAFRKAEGG